MAKYFLRIDHPIFRVNIFIMSAHRMIGTNDFRHEYKGSPPLSLALPIHCRTTSHHKCAIFPIIVTSLVWNSNVLAHANDSPRTTIRILVYNFPVLGVTTQIQSVRTQAHFQVVIQLNNARRYRSRASSCIYHVIIKIV